MIETAAECERSKNVKGKFGNANEDTARLRQEKNH